jgi:DNA-binding MarR family transcriptional regulator
MNSPDRDHVERVIELWERERPELDFSPVGVVSRIGRAARYLDHGIETVLAEHGLSRASWDVLAALRRVGEPYRLSPTELYRSLMRTSGAITHRLRGLEATGLVRRVGDPDDLRSAPVELTPAGKRLVDRVAVEHLANERELLAGLEEGEREQLAELLRKLLLSFERERPVPPEPKRRKRRLRQRRSA